MTLSILKLSASKKLSPLFVLLPLSVLLSLLLCILPLALPVTAQTKPSLEKLWITEGLQVPESVLFYHEEKSAYLLVSQINGDPSAVDGNGSIAKMTTTGELVVPDWITGLNAPKGMAAFAGKLYVADINEVVVINIKKAKIEQKIPVAGAQFLNDVAVDFQGVVYVSDTNTQKVHRIINGVVEDYLYKIEKANGLKGISTNLMVGAGTRLFMIDKDKNRLPFASGFAQPIDGIESAGRGNFIVSCWAGLIYYVNASGKLDVLLDSQQDKINTADIGYDQASRTLYVPNFFKNTVTAYRLVLN
jgi:hypothetical protein